MSTSGPLHIATRSQLRAYLTTLAGRRHGWGHLAIRHNTVARSSPCRFCDAGVARPAVGPALFWDGDPLCAACTREIAPELALYLAVLQAVIARAGGDWSRLQDAA